MGRSGPAREVFAAEPSAAEDFHWRRIDLGVNAIGVEFKEEGADLRYVVPIVVGAGVTSA